MIKYIDGDATQPIGEGKKVIAHICNDIGAFGCGFVVAISKRWDSPESYYKALIKSLPPENRLGIVQYCTVEKDIVVANMVAQHDIRRSADGTPPIRYDELRKCLRDVNTYCIVHNATVHAPRFGAGLSGGSWAIIEQIIKEEITVPVTIYDYDLVRQPLNLKSYEW